MNTKILIPIALCALLIIAVVKFIPLLIGIVSSLIGLVVAIIILLLLVWAIYSLFKWSLK